MKGYSTKYIMQPFFDMPNDRGELMKVYRTLAKSADQRLVRLEKLAGEENYKNATKWAYARAQRDIQAWSGEGATRFNTKPPESIVDLKAKIQDMIHFIGSETSTKSGIKDVMKKRADSLNKTLGTNFKWDEVGKFFNSKLWDKTKERFGSKTLVRSIGTIRSDKKLMKEVSDTADEIRKVKYSHIPKSTKQEIINELARNMDVPDNQVGETIRDILANYGPEVAKYLKTNK